ncbi:MAG: 1,4-dihydroxy-6-naphthoate synthase [Bacteroidales bacterium]|nr:1,4-dihydroxy-6-naphthoate synthase [Bacteroidales bacterium]
MKLTLAFSPCPNDTYIFDAMVHRKVDTEGLEFEYFMADVEKLNGDAFAEKPDITKLSFHAFLHLAGQYLLLDSGAALGFGAGPLVISKNLKNFADLKGKTVAIPGIYTTANLLFSLAMNKAEVIKKELLFSEIENAILCGEVDAGVIIHESRFTYQLKGLHKLIDLGEFWEQRTGYPVPLGGIAAHKRLGAEVIARVNRSIRRSVEYANSHKGELNGFIRCNAREMDDSVMQKHIDLYVNEFSISLGIQGRQAVTQLFEFAIAAGIISKMPERIFAPDL